MPRNKAFQEETVLACAMQVFWEKGYNATSMDDLVKGMGINRASLYDTFGDKKQLYLATLKFYQQQANQNAAQVMAPRQDSPKAQLIALAEYLMNDALTPSTKVRGCFLANATSEMALLDDEICAFVTENVHRFEGTFEHLIRAGQAKGEFPQHLAPADTASFISSYLYGIRTVSKTKPNAEKMRASLKLALSVLG
jgi:TetR/AcrR family transcriptional regulator, transcriptional repressor for nem operon